MLQIEIPRFGPPSVLSPRELPTPDPGPGELRVSVDAAGVNFADLMARMGLYDKTPPLPAVMGWEVAGTVDAVGEGVDTGWLATDVVGVTHFGGYATHVLVPPEQLVRRPAGLDAVTAAAVPIHGLSAWMMLDIMGRVREGDRVLIHSAGGGLGLMAVQLAKARGAFVVGTASATKHPTLREYGVDRIVDYTTEDVGQVLAGTGFDLVLDPLAGSSWRTSLDLLRGGGRLMLYGYSCAVGGRRRKLGTLARTMGTVPWLRFNPFSLMRANKGVMGMELEHLWGEAERVRGWFERVVALAEEGVMRPRVHATVPLEQAAEAHRMIHDRENIGKVVLVTHA